MTVLHPSLISHLSKYRSLMPSLALLFSLADGSTEKVGLDHAIRAEKWCDYLMGHAKRVYAARTDPKYSAALVLKNKIEKGLVGLPDGKLTVRDVYRKEWRELSKPEQVRAALTVLEENGWVRKYVDQGYDDMADVFGWPKTGRPSEVYEINPMVLDRVRGNGETAVVRD